MKKQSVFPVLTASLAMLTVIPGRFAYGLAAVILLNFLLFAGIVTRFALFRLGYGKFLRPVLLLVLTCLTILFQQLLYLFSAVFAVTMSFSLYIVCFSSLLVGMIFTKTDNSFTASLSKNYKKSGIFTLCALLLFALRDLLGFGTITLPVFSGLFEIKPLASFDGIVFFGSIPGAFMLLAAVLVIEYFSTSPEKRS